MSPLVADSNNKLTSKKNVSKKEARMWERDIRTLEKDFAISPDCVITHIDMKFKTPSTVTGIDSFYFNINKWNYLKKHGLITKNTIFIKDKLK